MCLKSRFQRVSLFVENATTTAARQAFAWGTGAKQITCDAERRKRRVHGIRLAGFGRRKSDVGFRWQEVKLRSSVRHVGSKAAWFPMGRGLSVRSEMASDSNSILKTWAEKKTKTFWVAVLKWLAYYKDGRRREKLLKNKTKLILNWNLNTREHFLSPNNASHYPCNCLFFSRMLLFTTGQDIYNCEPFSDIEILRFK